MSLYSNLTSFGRLLPECQARPAECVPMPSKVKVGGYIHIWADFQFPMMMVACLISLCQARPRRCRGLQGAAVKLMPGADLPALRCLQEVGEISDPALVVREKQETQGNRRISSTATARWVQARLAGSSDEVKSGWWIPECLLCSWRIFPEIFDHSCTSDFRV